MAQQVSADAAILAALKIWYTGRKFASLIWRNSPLARRIARIRIGGKTYNFAATGGGGAFSSDYTVMQSTLANSTVKNWEFSVPPGMAFAGFTINQLEKLSSRTERGAYIKLVADKMFGATEVMRKAVAAAYYGMGYGEVGTVSTSVANLATTMNVSSSAAVKLMIGSIFDVVESTDPRNSTLDTGSGGAHYRVTGMAPVQSDSTQVQITFTPGVQAASGWQAGWWICYAGGRDASNNPNMFTGLGGWIPSIFNRTGSDWTTYAATSFYGVTRSVQQSMLMGQYYQRQSTELYSQAVSQLVKLVRRGGGIPKLIVMNDNDYMKIQSELQSFRNFWQSVGIEPDNISNKNGPTYIYGLEALKYAFASTYIEEVYDDPYCPEGTFYVLDPDGASDKEEAAEGGAIEFAGLSNPDAIMNDRVVDNNPGRAPVDGETDATENPYELLIDDYLSVIPATATSTGPAAEVDLSLYGNLAVHSPGSNGVGNF